MEPVHRSPLSDQVVDRLRDEIATGRWGLGERIPPEPDLMASLGVARGTLREALRSLQYSGMLEIRRGDGTYVRARSELPGAIERSGADLGDVLEARAALEPVLARLAAERADDAALRRIDAALIARAGARDGHWVDADLDFHLAVADAAGNPILGEVYAALLPRIREVMLTAYVQPLFAHDDRRGHEEVFDAIRARDGEAAARSAHANLAATEHWAGSALPALPPADR